MANDELDPAIVVDRVSKFYRVFASPTDRVMRVLGRSSRHLDFQALGDVSFTVERGQAVGIIGENGAGKSTLMKIVAGTTSPTLGSVEVRGRVASILELGTAFHPEFTGRENAVLYGALMGLGEDEMRGRLDRILAFAELGQFIDHPIKTYSTGMSMRLAFAVATQVDPDVLLIDEALAVGDGYFQKKCIDRLLEIRERGTTVLFCSHSMYYVNLFCQRAIWLREGRVERVGATVDVVNAYEEYLLRRDARRLEAQPAEPAQAPSLGRRVGRIVSVRVNEGEDMDGDSQPRRMTAEIEFETVEPEEKYHVGLSLDTVDGKCVFAASTHLDGLEAFSGRSRYGVRLSVPDLPLTAGTFTMYAYLLDESGLHIHDQIVAPQGFKVTAKQWHPALLSVPHAWAEVGD